MLLYFLALFLPPVSVFLKRGCSADFIINILLSILGWIPGVIREINRGNNGDVDANHLLQMPGTSSRSMGE